MPTSFPGSSRRWSSRREFDHLSESLAVAERRDFERAALPLIRTVWPQARLAPELKSFDRSGIDHLVWSDGPRLPLVVQCKGFVAAEHELGESQARQCVESIESFARSGLRTDHYVLAHNRDGRSAIFRAPVEAALKSLVDAGIASDAELVDRQRLVLLAFQTLEVRLLDAIEERSRAAGGLALKPLASSGSLIDAVPLRDGSFVADQNRRLSVDAGGVVTADPTKLLQTPIAEGQSLTLLIGQAGFGKTTAALRAWASEPRATFYVQAATLSKDIKSTKDLTIACIPPELFDDLDGLHNEDRELHRFVSRAIISRHFAREDLKARLLIDGLDESVFFARTEGLHHLFNMLRDVKIPVILTSRSEHWQARQTDFAVSTGEVSDTMRRRQRVRLIELLPWTPEHIVSLVDAAIGRSVKDAATTHRLLSLRTLISAGNWAQSYGDLLTRPLFLGMILDTVIAGIDLTDRTISRPQLFQEWIRLKVVRDVVGPLEHGGDGRGGLLGVHSTDEIVRLAFRLMEEAAGLMTEEVDGELAMTASCSFRDLASKLGAGYTADSLSVFLHTLLVPTDSPDASDLRIGFIHRTLQEYFLARTLSRARAGSAALPPTVRDWLEEVSSADRRLPQ